MTFVFCLILLHPVHQDFHGTGMPDKHGSYLVAQDVDIIVSGLSHESSNGIILAIACHVLAYSPESAVSMFS